MSYTKDQELHEYFAKRQRIVNIAIGIDFSFMTLLPKVYKIDRPTYVGNLVITQPTRKWYDVQGRWLCFNFQPIFKYYFPQTQEGLNHDIFFKAKL